MKKILLIALVLVLSVGGAVFAQASVPVFCGDLAQADCDLLTRSQETMQSLDSAGFGFNVNVMLTNFPDMPDSATINVMGDGAFSGASSIQTDMTAAEADPSAAILSVLDNLDFDFTVTVTVPPELMTEVDKNAPNSLTLQMRLVDGVGYLNLDTLTDILGDMGDSGFKGWNGIDLAGLLRALMKQMPDLFSGMTAMGMDSSAMQPYIEQFSDPEFLSKFMTIEKVDIGMPDETTFRLTLDFSTLMSEPAFQDMMRQQIEAQGQTMSQAELDQAMAMSSQMFKDVTFVIDETIGTEDAHLRAMHGTFTMDMSAMMAAMESESGSKAGSSSQPAPSLALDLTVFYNSFDSVPPITAPEDATVIPYESLLGMMGSMSGTQQSG
ncbi:MAG: hypothetical protein U0703_00350 [Anaerolineae bacterium]